MINRTALVTATILLLHSVAWDRAAAAGERGPSTPDERAEALRLVELLESTPEAPAAKDAIQWLTVWLVNVPDVTVRLCLDPLGSPKELKGVPPKLTVQQAFSQAAFLIRNPEARSGSLEVYVAGVEGALRSYEAMRTAGAVAALKPFEALKKEQAAGRLAEVVKKRIKKC